MNGRARIAWVTTAAVAAAAALGVRAFARDRGAEPAKGPGASAPQVLATAADPWTVPAAPETPVEIARFETLTVADGLPSDRVTSVLAEGDDLYVGTEHGLGIRRAGRWTTVGTEQGLPHPFVTSVARDPAADVTWASTLRGVCRISGGAVETISQRSSGLQNDVVYHVRFESPRLWCATPAGISVLDTRTGSWSSYDQQNSIMHEPWCYAVAFGPQRAWIGVWGGGIVELDRAAGTWREYRDPDGEMEIDLLPDDGALHEVTSFVGYGSGLLWQTTYFGVARFDGRRWASWTKKDGGLPGDFAVHVAPQGRAAWIATDEGLGRIDGDLVTSFKRAADGSCDVRETRAGRETGTRRLASAPGDDAITWTFPHAGGVWVATGHGLSHGLPAAPAK